jgi:hypothetical protein
MSAEVNEFAMRYTDTTIMFEKYSESHATRSALRLAQTRTNLFDVVCSEFRWSLVRQMAIVDVTEEQQRPLLRFGCFGGAPRFAQRVHDSKLEAMRSGTPAVGLLTLLHSVDCMLLTFGCCCMQSRSHFSRLYCCFGALAQCELLHAASRSRHSVKGGGFCLLPELQTFLFSLYLPC